MLDMVSTVEWSGILFYTFTGNINKLEEMIFTLHDFYPLDIGTSGYTEYKATPDIVDYYSDYPDRIHMKQGHIHSHNSMSVFFSGTDASQLSDGVTKEQFDLLLSVIVNNARDVVAKIAIRTKVSYKICKTVLFNKVKLPSKKESRVAVEATISDCTIVGTIKLEKELDVDLERLNRKIRSLQTAVRTTITHWPNYGANMHNPTVPINTGRYRDLFKEYEEVKASIPFKDTINGNAPKKDGKSSIYTPTYLRESLILLVDESCINYTEYAAAEAIRTKLDNDVDLLFAKVYEHVTVANLWKLFECEVHSDLAAMIELCLESIAEITENGDDDFHFILLQAIAERLEDIQDMLI